MDARVAIYARVSSDRQAKDGTIASQVEALRERVERDGYRWDECLCFLDDGYSGSTLVRPALEQLRDAVYAGDVDRLYLLAPDRLARRHAYQVLLVEEFRRQGVEIVFLNRPPLGDSPETDLLLQVQGIIAEYERANILERCRRGKRSAARRGAVSVFSRAPYGYRYVPRAEGGGEARFQVVLEQARVVQQMFRWVALEQLPISEVSRRLTRNGIGSPSGQLRWSRCSVHKILKNPAYSGCAAFGRTRSGPRRARLRPKRGHPDLPRQPISSYATAPAEQIAVAVSPLVSGELFQAVQEQLAENRLRHRARADGPRHLLQGLVVCSCCGYAYSPKRVGPRTRPHAYYACLGSQAHRHGGQRVCTNKMVRGDMLDDAVWQDACALLRDPQRLLAEYDRRLSDAPRNEAFAALQKRIRHTQRCCARLIDAYGEGLVTKEEFEPRLSSLRSRLADLETQLQAEQSEQSERAHIRELIGDFEQFAQRVHNSLSNPDWQTRRSILCTLMKRVEIHPHTVRIIYRVNPYPFALAPNRGPLRHCLPRPNVGTHLPRSSRFA